MIVLIKIIYFLFFAATDLLVYLVLNKRGSIKPRSLWIFGSIFLVVLLLHTRIVSWSFLLPAQQFFAATICAGAPVIVYLWFNYIVLKRIKITKEKAGASRAAFFDRATRLFSFVFLKLFYLMAFFMQCVIIIEQLPLNK